MKLNVKITHTHKKKINLPNIELVENIEKNLNFNKY